MERDPNLPTGQEPAGAGAAAAAAEWETGQSPRGEQGFDPAAPETAASPPDQSEPTEQEPDWRAQLESERQRAQMYEQRLRQFDDIVARAQVEAAEQQAAQESQSRIDQAYLAARNMDPEAGLQFVRRFEEQERVALRAQIGQIRQEGEARAMAMVAQVAAPLYAQDLAKQNGLPPEYAQHLAAMHPNVMEQNIPLLKAQYAREQTLLKRIEQAERSQRAGQLSASGAHNPGAGTGIAPAPSDYEPGSTDELRAIFARAGRTL